MERIEEDARYYYIYKDPRFLRFGLSVENDEVGFGLRSGGCFHSDGRLRIPKEGPLTKNELPPLETVSMLDMLPRKASG